MIKNNILKNEEFLEVSEYLYNTSYSKAILIEDDFKIKANKLKKEYDRIQSLVESNVHISSSVLTDFTSLMQQTIFERKMYFCHLLKQLEEKFNDLKMTDFIGHPLVIPKMFKYKQYRSEIELEGETNTLQKFRPNNDISKITDISLLNSALIIVFDDFERNERNIYEAKLLEKELIEMQNAEKLKQETTGIQKEKDAMFLIK